jgi:hypothetical protein
MDQYFVAPTSPAFDASATLLTPSDAPYSRPTELSTLPASRSNTLGSTWKSTLRRRSPTSESNSNTGRQQQSASAVGGKQQQQQRAHHQDDEEGRRGVPRSPPPPARLPFFTRQDIRTPSTREQQRQEDEEATNIDKTLSEEEYQQLYGDLSPPPTRYYSRGERKEKREKHSSVESKGMDDAENEEEGEERPLEEELPTVTSYNPPTRLHEVCRYASTVDELVRTEKQYLSVQAAGCSDDQGQTPMHVLARNHQLSHNLAAIEEEERLQHSLFERVFESKAEKKMRNFVAGVLLKTYPAAMMTCDSQGLIPFEGPLIGWVNNVHDSVKPGLNSNRQEGTTSDRFPRRFTSFWMSTQSLTSLGTRWSNPASARKPSLNVVQEDHPKLSASPDTTKSIKDVEAPGTPALLSPRNQARMRRQGADVRERSFPKKVALTAHAHFCFQMLSAILDQLDRLQLNKSTRRRSLLLQRPDDDDDTCSIHSAVEELKSLTVHDIRTEIVQSIASIPGLVKTILLLEDDDQRNFVLSTSLFRRVLVSKHSVGRWLTGMLQSSERRVWERAVEYLKLASDPSFHMLDQGSTLRTGPRNKSRTIVTDEPDELYQEVARLQDFVPSLLSLGEKEVEEVATTILVRRVLDRIISRPFTLTVVVCDAVFLVILIVGYRVAVNRLLLGSPPGDVLVSIYVANAGIFYFIIRELGKAVSLCMITRHARIYFWSFWNVTDLLSTILALVSTVAIRGMFISNNTNVDNSGALRILLAVTTGFLWLRVLNFLKGINLQLATFVLAILQVRI